MKLSGVNKRCVNCDKKCKQYKQVVIIRCYKDVESRKH
jgi:hypothetical protein